MLALFAPGLWWRLRVLFFSSPHRIGPDRQTGLILGSVAGAAVIQCAQDQPPALAAPRAPRRSGSGDPAAVLVFYACGGRICVEGRRLVVDDGFLPQTLGYSGYWGHMVRKSRHSCRRGSDTGSRPRRFVNADQPD